MKLGPVIWEGLDLIYGVCLNPGQPFIYQHLHGNPKKWFQMGHTATATSRIRHEVYLNPVVSRTVLSS